MDLLQPLFIGKNKVFVKEVPSTNSYATELLSKTNPIEGTCVIAEFQSAGKGQIGRFWHSKAGVNLLVSYILYPKTIKAIDQFYLTMVGSLAVFDVINEFYPQTKIKWPNDIYCGDSKISGILIQNSLRNDSINNTIIGIGVNINEVDFPVILPNPTSLALLTQKKYSIEEILDKISTRLEFYYLKLKSGQNDFLNKKYLENLYRINVLSDFKLSTGSGFSGQITGIDSIGRLKIIRESGTEEVYGFREISYVI